MKLLDVITHTSNFVFGASRTVITGNYSSTEIDVLVTNVNDIDDTRYAVFLKIIDQYISEDGFSLPIEVLLKSLQVPGVTNTIHFVISVQPQYSSIVLLDEIKNLVLFMTDEHTDELTADNVNLASKKTLNDAAIAELASMKAALVASL